MSAADLLVIEDLRVEYLTETGAVRVVDDVSFRIGAGEAYGLAGESGSGKSTIALAILRLLRPPAAITNGRVSFDGTDLLSLGAAALRDVRGKQISLITQGAMSALNPVLRVDEQLADAIMAHERASRREAFERAAGLCDVVGLEREWLRSYPHQLSGGMRQRAVIAIALALRPKLIIMDEPTTALDVVVQQQILRRILALKEKMGFSILFITHDLALMLQVCGRVGILSAGRLVETAPAATIVSAPQHPYTRGLMSSFLDVHQPKGDRRARPGAPPAPPAEAPLLSVRGLGKTFHREGGSGRRELHVLRDVSFDVRAGEVVALVGESGSGKSTTALLIARLLVPTTGEIRLRGVDVLSTEPLRASLAYRREVQMIFQDPFSSLNPIHTIRYHLERPLLRHGEATNEADLAEKVNRLLETVGLTPAADFARRHPHQLSGGQRQRVAIARALSVNPALIVADEPTSMLDMSLRIDLLNLMRDIKSDRRIGYLFITHDLGTARFFADRLLVMYAGEIVEAGISEDVLDTPAHPYTRLLISAVPSATTAQASAEEAGGGGGRGAPVSGHGCAFADRCPSVMDRCRQEAPALRPLGPGRTVRCHLYP